VRDLPHASDLEPATNLDRTACINRIRGLLAEFGLRVPSIGCLEFFLRVERKLNHALE